ncbi:DUF4382 domain-containing protein [Methylonatrum kenyense]|uniref:DUF4382 domain-containing protein n=1 Tax=Methylonatrum kenyense TaxID=455253 RepID=UPI0020C0757D|nr:DUF4382 domain-containing protein [Methylonatrum kenyense]MCK8517124.1 DUF4382 domain-containing protein [Methylonatrum kenyense]
MTINLKRLCLLGLVAASATLLACNSGSSGGSSSSSGETGQLSLAVTDGPIDNATNVFLRFTAVELRGPSGRQELIEFESVREIDLLALQGEESEALFVGEEVPAGEYNQIRFLIEPDESQSGPPQNRQVTTSVIRFADEPEQRLAIPGGEPAGVQTQGSFTVPPGGVLALTADFDLRKMITRGVGTQWDGFHRLRRTGIRIIENADVGVIRGQVDASIIPNEIVEQCMPHPDEDKNHYICPGAAVYVYEGIGDDVEFLNIRTDEDGEDLDGNPITTANVRYMPIEDEESNGETWGYFYSAGFVPEGDYTVALTFDADSDDAERDTPIDFVDWSPAPVEAGQATVVNFPTENFEDPGEEDEEENGEDEENGE